MRHALFICYLALLSILGYLATDMYLPAFTPIQQSLATTPNKIGLSLSLFLAGYAFAQLFWGPLTDRYGAKKALLSGLTLFSISSIALFFTSNIDIFLGLRLLQAIGTCACAVCWQSLVITHYEASKARKVFATIMPLVALSPALSPVIGAFVLDHLGWRNIFSLLALISLLLIVLTALLLNHPKVSAVPDSETVLASNSSYFTLFHSPVFMGYVTLYAACTASFFAWLSGSPFFLALMGYSPKEIGLSYIPQTLMFLIGGYSYRFFFKNKATQQLIPWLLIIYCLTMLLLFIASFYPGVHLTTLLIPFCIMAFVNGLGYPIYVANALAPFKAIAGKASALQNTLQLGSCFIASTAVSLFLTTPLIATTTVMLLTIPFVALGYALIQRQQ